MRVILGISVAIIILVIGFFNLFGVPRLLKTIYLIVRVSPYEQKAEGDKKILVLGDSTGYGTGSADNKNTVAGRMGREFPQYSITNKSTNGLTIGQLKDKLQNLLGDEKYTVVLLQMGGNDILQKRDLNVVKGELKIVFEQIKKHTDKIVMMSAGNVGAAPAFSGEEAKQYTELTRKFRAMFIALAAENGVSYVDLFHEPDEDPFVSDPKINTAIDGLHPSDAGYGIWYNTLSPVLHQLLQK